MNENNAFIKIESELESELESESESELELESESESELESESEAGTKIEKEKKIDQEQESTNKSIIKFCVFVGRQSNLIILHKYIECALYNNIFDEYHMFDFSRNIKDSEFIIKEYHRLSEIFSERIYIHNHENNLINLNNTNLNNKNTNRIDKPNWNPFYKRINEISENEDIIIKCDDDILFIDLNGLKRAIDDRRDDKDTFLIHSNCINNGVCAYYHRNAFGKISDKLNIYPKGGILGILFEKPEIAYGMHSDFLNNCDKSGPDININKYYIDDVFINSRISINFILINGRDLKYMKDVSHNDEYELSSFIPEKLGRVNKIKGDFITCHYSYSFQEKIMFHRGDIYNKYHTLSKNIIDKFKFDTEIYTEFKKKTNEENKNNLVDKIERPIIHKIGDNNIFKVKNWINTKSYYIKNADNNKYLYINYEKDDVMVSKTNKTIFEINFYSNISDNQTNNEFEINLGIYFFTKYNVLGKFKNEVILAKNMQDKNEKILFKEKYDAINNSAYIKFKKYNSYLSLSERNIDFVDVTLIPQTKWILEKIIKDDTNNNDEYIIASRIEKNNKFYYKNVNDSDNNLDNECNYFTNFYLGWGWEGCVW
jgi:hypothetical protein